MAGAREVLHRWQVGVFAQHVAYVEPEVIVA
jgi:hypothetical protein